MLPEEVLANAWKMQLEVSEAIKEELEEVQTRLFDWYKDRVDEDYEHQRLQEAAEEIKRIIGMRLAEEESSEVPAPRDITIETKDSDLPPGFDKGNKEGWKK